MKVPSKHNSNLWLMNLFSSWTKLFFVSSPKEPRQVQCYCNFCYIAWQSKCLIRNTRVYSKARGVLGTSVTKKCLQCLPWLHWVMQGLFTLSKFYCGNGWDSYNGLGHLGQGNRNSTNLICITLHRVAKTTAAVSAISAAKPGQCK